MNNGKEFLGKIITVKIDRPLGGKHPVYGNIYPVNYGFVPGTKARDGHEVDVFILGVNEPVKEFTGKCIAYIDREDDCEDKLVVVLEGKDFSDKEIMGMLEFQEKYFKSKVVRE